mgnify:CR=1 FL=1
MRLGIEYKSFNKLVKKIIDNRGKTCPVVRSGFPLIATNCILNRNLYPIFENIRFVSQETYETWFRGHPEPGDMIFVLKGTPGRVNWVPDPVNFCIAQDMVAIRANEQEVYPKYLFAALRSSIIQQEIENLHVGTLIPHFKKSDFDKLFIPCPSYKMQTYIGDTYFYFSQKIDLLQRQNATLEAMAETLFRERFISYSHKDSMVAIDSYILFNPKRSIRKGDMSPYLEMSNLRTDAFCPIEFYDKEFTSGSKFINGDTLLARITPCLENGKKCFVNFLEDGAVAWGSTEYIVMHPMDELHPLFAYCLVKTDDFRGYAESCLSGSSGRQRVDVTHLKQYEIKSPRKNDINDFNRFCTAIEPKLLNNYKKIKTLEKLRDTLLPKLMSGEVRVRVDG